MAYIFVADDFTGASDTLATLSRAGVRARLFRNLPGPADLEGLEAWGIATAARSIGRHEIARLAAEIGAGLAPHAPDFLHLKVCSTFDSSPEIGNIAALAQGLADALGIADLAVIGGQPSLGRHAVFGTLFARGPDGRVHRIDRHPVMSAHPVTPMHEADLIRHLGALGLNGLHHVGRGCHGGAFPRFYDALDQADIAFIGKDLRVAGDRLLVMGASSVAEAWLAGRPARAESVPPPRPSTGPVFAFAGSRSSLTTTQIAAASGLSCLPLNPADLMAEAEAFHAAIAWSKERLDRGQDCIVYLTAEMASAAPPAEIARMSAEFVAQVIDTARIGGLVIAGGDTSSAIVNRLAPCWLDHAGDICPGVPILHAGFEGRGLLLALKGGQMGDARFFDRAAAEIHGH
ncbi:four-carbon acid sugar kinase family protein [Paracoccus ravus]|uniref:four-carbon acid sugar kinase family protein n=1 Tax=Paracoccus ravus TaxID=2447760 RepID=UPI00106EE9DD|nr:four-carbon acid sugar kinase family protein [Paracoccus ravus]